MKIGMVGLGRMGANMARRLMRGGHSCVVFDRSAEAVASLVREGALGAASPAELIERLPQPRVIWIMVPASVVDETIGALAPSLSPGDTLIDGGNSHYVDDMERAEALEKTGVHYVDVGTSGGIWGLERGYCMMIGGEASVVSRLDPIFMTLAPGKGDVAGTPGRENAAGTAEHGYLHCGPSGGGHFVKMVHNGIEYGLMAAYAEGFNVLRGANAGKRAAASDAETAPMREPGRYLYDFPLPDIAEVWRRGSVVASWLLDLTASALAGDPELTHFSGHVSDSGEGRWTLQAGIDEGIPTPVLTAAVHERFSSRGAASYQDKLLSAMRYQFGGHIEKKSGA